MSSISTPIEHKVLVRKDRKYVYDAMTTSEGLDGWFTRGSEVDRRPGGTVIFRWVDWGPDKTTATVTCPILEVSVPSRFVFKWWDDHYTTVELSFEETDGGTVVSVREHGYQDSEEGHRRCLECATGWGEALTLLKFYAEHGLRY